MGVGRRRRGSDEERVGKVEERAKEELYRWGE